MKSSSITLTGYVNAVERDSHVIHELGRTFVERIAAGAFAKALEQAEEIELKLNHARVLGSTADGALTLEEDAIGLKATAIVTDEEVIRLAEADRLRGWSFGFVCPAGGDDWEESETEGLERRIVRELELNEVSILSIDPAYIATTVEERGQTPGKRKVELRSSEADIQVETSAHQPDARFFIRSMEIELLKIKGGRIRNGKA